MRIFSGFLCILCSVFLWLLPISSSIYDFRTDLRTDSYNYSTGVGITTGNIVLLKPIYDDDTGTISFSSNDSSDSTAYVSYNSTSRLLNFSGLSANSTRLLDISYDVSSLEGNDALEFLLDRLIWIYWILIILFPMAGLVSIFWDKMPWA